MSISASERTPLQYHNIRLRLLLRPAIIRGTQLTHNSRTAHNPQPLITVPSRIRANLHCIYFRPSLLIRSTRLDCCISPSSSLDSSIASPSLTGFRRPHPTYLRPLPAKISGSHCLIRCTGLEIGFYLDIEPYTYYRLIFPGERAVPNCTPALDHLYAHLKQTQAISGILSYLSRTST